VAQMVKDLPAMWEMCILSLDWEDSLEEGTAAVKRAARAIRERDRELYSL